MTAVLLLIAACVVALAFILRAVRRELRQAAANLMPDLRMPDGEPWPGVCGDRWEGMTCTRPRGHDGLHADDTSWEME